MRVSVWGAVGVTDGQGAVCGLGTGMVLLKGGMMCDWETSLLGGFRPAHCRLNMTLYTSMD